ncbi:MAG: hypothetical protein MZV64_18970 [Ignavibacteriales bacterium]|nr:hypothetical protein [Ignavibacteriales bacterium]
MLADAIEDRCADAKWNVTVSVWNDKEVIASPAWVSRRQLRRGGGYRLDNGRALYLCNLRTGELLAAESEMNPQIVYGEDVMSRIQYTIEHPDGLEKVTQGNYCHVEQVVEAGGENSKHVIASARCEAIPH